MGELRDKIAMKMDDLKMREVGLLDSLSEFHQVVDADRLAKNLMKRATLKNVLEGHFDRI